MNAILALEDGTWYRGVAAGATGEARGEVVFELLPGETGSEGPLCKRRLVECDGQWITQQLNGN